jgi:hypothetical protein
MTASSQFRTLAGLPASELDAFMRRGETPAADSLAGVEFRGANTADWTRRLRMRQFIKGFERRPDGRLFGYNRRVDQDGLDGRWASPSDRFAFFEVREVDPASRDNRYLQALLLDYAAGGNPRRDPSRPIRDYIVRVEPGLDEILLGRAFLALGRFRPSPTYFILERLRSAAS